MKCLYQTLPLLVSTLPPIPLFPRVSAGQLHPPTPTVGQCETGWLESALPAGGRALGPWVFSLSLVWPLPSPARLGLKGRSHLWHPAQPEDAGGEEKCRRPACLLLTFAAFRQRTSRLFHLFHLFCAALGPEWVDTALMADAWSPTHTIPRAYMIHAPHFLSLVYSTLPRVQYMMVLIIQALPQVYCKRPRQL